MIPHLAEDTAPIGTEMKHGHSSIHTKEAPMHAPTLPRFLLAALIVALIGAGMLASPVAADTTTWSDTGSGEDIFVWACHDFDITTNYTANRTFKVISNSSGDQVVERSYVSFAGTLANDATGQSLPYDGRFNRHSDYNRNQVMVTDLALRFDVGTSGQFSVAIARVELDLGPEPAAVVATVMPHALQLALCSVLGDLSGASAPQSVASYEERMFSGPSTNVHTENSALTQPANEADDDMTSWTELDPCDTSPPGQGC
jgi:hypothetical protein